ncbi:FeoB-associated Cys-rich membrane protein [Dokdonia sp.]
MDQIQNIIVLTIFLVAVGYLITKFVWTPSFLKKKSKGGCGDGKCGC